MGLGQHATSSIHKMCESFCSMSLQSQFWGNPFLVGEVALSSTTEKTAPPIDSAAGRWTRSWARRGWKLSVFVRRSQCHARLPLQSISYVATTLFTYNVHTDMCVCMYIYIYVYTYIYIWYIHVYIHIMYCMHTCIYEIIQHTYTGIWVPSFQSFFFSCWFCSSFVALTGSVVRVVNHWRTKWDGPPRFVPFPLSINKQKVKIYVLYVRYIYIYIYLCIYPYQ